MEAFRTINQASQTSSRNMHYGYGDAEGYLESHTSNSQSPINSPFDMSYIPNCNTLTNVYPSSEHDDESPQKTETQAAKPAPKRKRENRYKNAPASVLSQRRRAQNRASQRAYRERKDQRIRDLESMLSEAKQRNDVLSQAYACLHTEYLYMKSSQLKDRQHQQAPVFLDMGVGFQGTTASARPDMNMFIYPDLGGGRTYAANL